jgi:transposase
MDVISTRSCGPCAANQRSYSVAGTRPAARADCSGVRLGALAGEAVGQPGHQRVAIPGDAVDAVAGVAQGVEHLDHRRRRVEAHGVAEPAVLGGVGRHHDRDPGVGRGRGELTDGAWARIEPLLPGGGSRGGQWRDHRQVLNGILWNLRTGAPWRDLPERYGPWKTAHERLRRWTADGTWDRVLDEVVVKDDAVGRVAVDGRGLPMSILVSPGQAGAVIRAGRRAASLPSDRACGGRDCAPGSEP